MRTHPRLTTPGPLAGGALVTVALALAACDEPVSERPGESPGGATIETGIVGRLDFGDVAVAPSFSARVFTLPGGGWGVTAPEFDRVVQLFDAAGRPAGTLGGAGEGPGEFSGTVFGNTLGEELWVVDPEANRLSRWSEEGTLLGERPLTFTYGRIFSVASDAARDGLVLGGFFADEASLARVGATAEDEVLGGEIPELVGSGRVAVGGQMQMAVPVGGEVWSFSRMDGMLRVHDTDLAVVERIRIPFPDTSALAWGEAVMEGAPPPEVMGLLAHGGLVWIVAGVPDADWSPDLRPAEVGVDGMIDTWLFAVDPAGRAVVATHRLDPVCFPAYDAVVSCVDEIEQVVTLRTLELSR